MPEGPEVSRIAEALHRRLSGKYLLGGALLPHCRYFPDGGFKNMELLKKGLFLESISAKGKKVVFKFLTQTRSQIFMISALGMEGHWLFKPLNHTALYMKFGNKTNRLNTLTDILFYDDSCKFGIINICTSESELKLVFKAVGPDLLHDNVTFEQYYGVLKQSSLQNKEIAIFLLEQKFFSGIGNYIRSEMLYLAKMSPFRVIGTLSDGEIRLLYDVALFVLREAYSKNGLTFATYLDPDEGKGTYETYVYKRKYDHAGNPVLKTKMKDKRTVHWVQEVQR